MYILYGHERRVAKVLASNSSLPSSVAGPRPQFAMAGFFRRRLLLGVLCFALCFVSSIGELQRFEHQAKADGSLSLLVIGDWGRKGGFNQSHVAHQMGVVGEKLDINFVVSTGDNFYDKGLQGVDDPAFEESFSSIYTAPSLQTTWYSVLGNHDYRGDAVAQISPVLRKIDGRWLCLRSFQLNSGIADLFFIDTTPFVDYYFSDPGGQTYDWRDVQPRESYLANSLKDLDLALRESAAKWKIVIGHHPIRSISHHGDTPEVVKLLLPILKANDVDFYMNGHDHCLEHINDINSPIQFLTSGAGSKAWRGDMRPNSGGVKFFYDGQGFMSMELTQSRAEIGFYDVHGRTLHRWARLKEEFRSEA